MLNRRILITTLTTTVAAGGLFLEGAVASTQLGEQMGQSTSQSIASGATSGTAAASYQTIFVDPTVGDDQAQGLENQPLQTVTRALELAPPNTVIVLAPGRYTQATGEVFPLQLKPGVTIQGTPGSRDRTAIIEGGGTFESPTRSQQNAAVLAADRAGIAQVAISNPDGYGVWVESGSPTILETAFVGNRQTGLYVTGGSPRVQGSYFSGNQVAGMIVFGVSSANIQSNIFDSTGDAIRVVDGATPEIVGNRIINNNAGLVLIGNANPVLRDNQIVGNRRNEIIEVAARPQEISSSSVLVTEETAIETVSTDQLPVAAPPVSQLASPPSSEIAALPAPAVTLPEPALPAPALPTPSQSAPIQTEQPAQVEQPINIPVTPAPTNLATAVPVEPAAMVEDELENQIPAGAPGAALQALQSGLALGPRAVTGENQTSPSPILNNRNRPTPNEPAPVRPEEPVYRAPINNNRLAVPNSSIPVGSGSSATSFSPPRGGAGAPPAPPSRAQSLGLYYRVFVEASDPFVQDEIRRVVPDAFRTNFDGRMMMQVGAFPTEAEAEDRRRLLEDNNFNARVEVIR